MKELLNKVNLEIEELKAIENELKTQLDTLEDALESLIKAVEESSNYKEIKNKRDNLYLEWFRKSRKRKELEKVKNAILSFNEIKE